ncbi:hypothetical protein P153DRAFT_401922 [Dothidotthia symphoricarpi CBS 119687]|uniref:Uncharacterized protein n=1 Tax=Dothidotthia symphoricarpi CBS 119687 TaxID=1392245 RepID=A0A6A5ZUP6_9PLEO|nr:uncharacterized protein P153DRAFT_401922 [Dothidotthia symphoricarpi CBS 119687]KAF2123442.1 hypothetical protein P153DRAFT_401922 [Dothidotthia symphoricarpi CBS 119687]
MSKFLTFQILDDSNLNDNYKQGFCDEEVDQKASTSSGGTDVCNSASADAILARTRSWLDAKCLQEQASADWAPEFSRERWSTFQEQEGSIHGSPAIDTTILERIHAGRGPRDPSYEVDLLAAVRLEPVEMIEGPEPEYVRETYKATSKVLLEWNLHISADKYDPELSKALVGVLNERVRLFGEVQKGTANPTILNKTSDSSRQIIQALCALRPEVARFSTLNPTTILYILWAYIGRAVPDMDDDLKYATMRVLLGERLLMSSVKNKRRREMMEDDIKTSRQRGEMIRVQRLEEERSKEERILCEAAKTETRQRIKYARRGVREEALRELQQLTLLQAAQKWAFGDKTIPPWTGLHQACADADTNLRRTLLQKADDLDASCHALDANADLFRRLHRKVLTRALKFVGRDLNCDDATREKVIKERMNDPDTLRMMIEVNADLAGQKQAAGQLHEQMDMVEASLNPLLDAAKVQYRAHDGLSRVLNCEQSLSVSGDFDAEMQEKCGPDRDEVVLMMMRELQATGDEASELSVEDEDQGASRENNSHL